MSLQSPNFFYHSKLFESEHRKKFKPTTLSKIRAKQHTDGISRKNLLLGFSLTCHPSSEVTSLRRITLGALSSAASSADFNQRKSKDEALATVSHSQAVELNRVDCLVSVLHESASSFSLAVQSLELAGSGPELAMAWAGVDVHAWHKRIAYQVAVYAMFKAAIQVEMFLSHKHCDNPSPVCEILSAKIIHLGEVIDSQLNLRHPHLVQWFKSVELPRVAGLFIPLFKKWCMVYAGSGVAGIILAISCCAAVGKLGSGRISCPLFSESVDEISLELMNMSYNLISVDKLHNLAAEAGFEQEFLSHFGTNVLPGKNTEEIEFWIGLVQKKLSEAFRRESVILGKDTFNDKAQVNNLAALGLFAYLGRETRLFLSDMGIKDLDEQIKDFLSYLECGSHFIYPEFSSVSEYQLLMEVITDEIGWLDFYAAFRCKINQEKRRSKQHTIQAETEIVLSTILTVCYDVFSGFAHYCNSTQQPLESNLLSFLLQSQNLLATCLEDYWAAYDKFGELKIAEKDVSDPAPSLRSKGPIYLSLPLEAQQYPIDLLKSESFQHGSKRRKDISSVGIDPVTSNEVGYAVELKPLQENFLRKSTTKLASATADIWLGTKLLFIDMSDSFRLLMKQLRGYQVTRRERKKIDKTLADIATLIPITILMLLPVSAVGHAAMLAAIKKYMPSLIPSPFSSGRLDIVKQLKRTKKMNTQSWSNIADASSTDSLM